MFISWLALYPILCLEYALICLASTSFFLLPQRQMRMASVLLLRYESQHNLIQNGDGNEKTGDISV